MSDYPVCCSVCDAFLRWTDDEEGEFDSHADVADCINVLREARDRHEAQYTAPSTARFPGVRGVVVVRGDSLRLNQREGACPIVVWMMPGEHITFAGGIYGELKRES